MLSLNISLAGIQLFFIIFLRVGAILFAAPFFGSKNVPISVKAGLAFSLSIILYPLVALETNLPARGLVILSIGIAGEIILGYIIGFVIRLVFSGIQLAGQMVGFQMGLAIANVLDPQSSAQVSIIAQLKYIVAILIFLSINAHHWLIRALVESFTIVPPLEFVFTGSLAKLIIMFANDMFIIAVKIGAPIMATLFLVSVAMGLIARSVPQMQIFIVAMPLQIMIGMAAIAFMMPYLVTFLTHIFNGLGKDLLMVLNAIK